jgi:transcriptional regulator with XRE-family HTH domain
MTADGRSLAVADMLVDLGRTLRSRRKRCGITRAELVTRMNYTYGAVLSAENGYRTSSRRFWAAADATLSAGGKLLAAADAVSLRVAAAKAGQAAEVEARADEELPPLPPLPRYRQVQKTNRAFADRLSTTAARRRRTRTWWKRPPGGAGSDESVVDAGEEHGVV